MPDCAAVAAFLDERHHALAAEVAAFAKREIASLPVAMDDASARSQARFLVQLLGRAGLVAHAHPLDLRACCLIRETLARESPLADEVFALQCLGSTPIALAGSPELRESLLPKVVSGELMAAFAMTEPGAGSDVAALGTRARRDGESYVLDGEKTLISNAGIADFYTVFAKTDPDGGHRGISCFVVDADAPGLGFDGALELSAPHPLGNISFRGCRVPASRRLGNEGDGFRIGMSTLDSLRATVAAAACGMAERALDEALAHVTSRQQFGAPLADLALVQHRLAAMALELTAARLLVYRAAAAKDSGAARVSVESAMAKAFATEAAQRIIDSAVQLLGGRGVLRESRVDQLYRAIRPLRIYEGTTDIQHVVIARALLKAHRDRG
ncbi:MAG: acyl-CoA dehydrogenase family protein [Polyangiaceae bacterium]|nr:acyl-CoA dehydrogenase family protein [Polyangiaceae bacterium]MCE7889919.1 acyl-CoA dehydrogenase [Sorangiineae bacterium PRO1]MCL4751798.1 acyl-CoA dehydrogenase family protein [Myxococcales bacterium]